jgi:hypothetical protein
LIRTAKDGAAKQPTLSFGLALLARPQTCFFDNAVLSTGELCPKMGDDGFAKAAYRGWC